MAVMIKAPRQVCVRCGRKIDIPDLDETRPLEDNLLEGARAILKHGWRYHRSDFPPQIRSFRQFMKWMLSPEGREWTTGQLAETERIVDERKAKLKEAYGPWAATIAMAFCPKNDFECIEREAKRLSSALERKGGGSDGNS